VPNCVEIGQTAVKISQFFDFPRWRGVPRWRSPPFWIFKIPNFQQLAASRGSKSVAMPNLGEIGGTLVIIHLVFGVPQGSVLGLLLLMVAHVIGQTIIFLPCDFYLSSSFFLA